MTVLVLGTAQWGAGYGITNAHGRLGDEAITGIMAAAQRAGIRSADTASDYGDAQLRLRPWAESLTITTKVIGAEPNWMVTQVAAACWELGVSRVDSCLIHDWDVLDAATRSAAVSGLAAARRGGLVADIGVSTYGANGVRVARELFEPLDIVQVPANALDRRLDDDPMMPQLAAEGVRVQVRSVLLQGLLADATGTVFAEHPDVLRFYDFARDRGRSSAAIAIAHAKAIPWASEVVFGVTSAAELDEFTTLWHDTVPELTPPHLGSSDIELIDPRGWQA